MISLGILLPGRRQFQQQMISIKTFLLQAFYACIDVWVISSQETFIDRSIASSSKHSHLVVCRPVLFVPMCVSYSTKTERMTVVTCWSMLEKLCRGDVFSTYSRVARGEYAAIKNGDSDRLSTESRGEVHMGLPLVFARVHLFDVDQSDYLIKHKIGSYVCMHDKRLYGTGIWHDNNGIYGTRITRCTIWSYLVSFVVKPYLLICMTWTETCHRQHSYSICYRVNMFAAIAI